MERWYALHTKPNMEYQVTAVLQDRGIQFYLPELTHPKLKGGKQPFFPSYLFIKVDFDQVSSSFVEWIPGLRRVVTFDNQPVSLPNKVIELMQHCLHDIKAAGGYPEYNFEPGEAVRIIDGPFKDMMAIFDRSTTPALRVQVLLNILGQASRVKVDVTDLEKLSPDKGSPTLRPPRRTRGQGRPIVAH
jgi:transcription elongation factor/antiterminator RfaH